MSNATGVLMTLHGLRHVWHCREVTSSKDGGAAKCAEGRDARTDLCIDSDVQANQVTAAVACEFILHAGIPAAPALQLVKEVCHNLQKSLSR